MTINPWRHHMRRGLDRLAGRDFVNPFDLRLGFYRIQHLLNVERLDEEGVMRAASLPAGAIILHIGRNHRDLRASLAGLP